VYRYTADAPKDGKYFTLVSAAAASAGTRARGVSGGMFVAIAAVAASLMAC
jgi:hypothetical protein